MSLRNVSALAAAFQCLASASFGAGPADFGRSEFTRAVAERGLTGSVALPRTGLARGNPECYSVTPDSITANDERGLMYGLLEAADQIRENGRLSKASGCPAVAMRGIRYFLHNEDLERNWYYSAEYWPQYFSMLAQNRFNRFNMVFAHQTNYLAPPYPFWLALPEFPEIRVPGLSAAQRQKNLEMLQYISQAAADHGIDFTLGIWEHNIQTRMTPTTAGITRENIGPYTHAALTRILQLCPAIRSVQMRTNEESGIPADYRVKFYRDYIYTAIRDAGLPVYLDLRAWAVAKDMIEAAEQVRVPLRVSTKYWAEDLGRPYQPAETYAGYSYLNFLQKPHSYQFYWELWGLGSHRLLLWGNPDYVRRAASTFHLGDAVGFEIDPPLAQKGFGNRPGVWGVFTDAHKDLMFWKWEFERYWMFYTLWGRLTYNPDARDSIWMRELRRRFGDAAPDVLAAYRNASGVLNEIVAAHLADPNMYIWPEINPGGLLDAYRDVLPSDWRYIASIPEAVQNRIHHIASAKQKARETAALLNGLAERTEQAVARASAKIRSANAEWQSSRSDFNVLALLARYHALKQTATDQVTYFDLTGDRGALESAERDVRAAIAVWEQLVHLTDGLYPEQMAFGPDDVGHWRDKLPYVRHDLELVRERMAIFDQFGRFDFGFDFGGPVKTPTSSAAYRANAFVLENTVAPRFLPVAPDTRYSDSSGYGWILDTPRTAVVIPLTPYLEVRAAAKNPTNLPHDVLYRDYIRGNGAQVFRVKTGPGNYTVHLLHPDRTEAVLHLAADGEYLNVTLPEGEWSVSGLVVQGPGSKVPLAPQTFPKVLPRPGIAHDAPREVIAGQPLTLRVRIAPSADVSRVRLYYRPVDQQAKFKSIEIDSGQNSVTIPGDEVSAQWDLMYYFEILNRAGGGWFCPDPQNATPYYVVKVRPGQ
jgi:hypothetical protein